MDEAGGLRVVPEAVCGPLPPPELVVEDPGEGPGGLGASDVVVLEGRVVPPASGGVEGPGGSGDQAHNLGLPLPQHACGKKPSLGVTWAPRLTCGGGLLL